MYPKLLLGLLLLTALCTRASAQEGEFLYPAPFYDGWIDVYVAPGGNGWAVGSCDNIIRTTDGGANWTDVSDEFNVDRWRSVTCLPGTNCRTVFLGINNRMLRSTDGGESWISHQVNSSRYDFSVPGHIFGYREGATDLFVSTDDGESWERTILPISPKDEILFESAAEFAYFGNNVFYRTTDGGQTFTESAPFPGNIALCTRASDGTYYASIRDRSFYASTDNGASWEVRSVQSHQSTVFKDLWQDTEDSLHLIHFLGIRESSADGGRTWQRTGGPGINFSNIRRAEGRVFGAGPVMAAYVSDDDWITHKYQFGDKRPVFRHFDFVDANRGFALADDGEVYRTSAGGRDWELVSVTGSGDAYHTYVMDDGSLVVSNQGGLYISRNGGQSWTDFPLPAGVSVSGRHAITRGPENTLFVAARETFLHLRLDGSVLLRNDNPGPGLVYSDLYFVSDQVGFYTASFTLPFWRTEDGGASWTEIPRLVVGNRPIPFNYLHFTTPLRGFAGSGAVKFKTEDGGLTWSNVGNILPGGNILLEDEDGNLYQQSGDRLYQSTDGGDNWNIISILDCSFSVHAAFRPGLNQIIGCTTGGFHRFDLDVISPVRERGHTQKLSVYPNPTDGRFSLRLPEAANGEIRVEVYSAAGRLVRTGRDAVLDLSEAPGGVYLVRALRNGTIYTGRVVVR